jgi:hypothetical protein
MCTGEFEMAHCHDPQVKLPTPPPCDARLNLVTNTTTTSHMNKVTVMLKILQFKD